MNDLEHSEYRESLPNIVWWLGITLVIAFAVLLCFYRLESPDLWTDEVLSQIKFDNLKDNLQLIARDVHPPMYFILSWWWKAFWNAQNEAGLRSFSALAGVGSKPPFRIVGWDSCSYIPIFLAVHQNAPLLWINGVLDFAGVGFSVSTRTEDYLVGSTVRVSEFRIDLYQLCRCGFDCGAAFYPPVRVSQRAVNLAKMAGGAAGCCDRISSLDSSDGTAGRSGEYCL